jgi:hypothetical protein
MGSLVTSDRAGLCRLLKRFPQWAEQEGLMALAEMPDPAGRAVEVSGDTTNAEQFVALAARAGARLLYYRGDYFDAGGFLGSYDLCAPEAEEDWEAADPHWREGVEQLRRDAHKHDADLQLVAACFVVDGVAHYWGARAQWPQELEERGTELGALRDVDVEHRLQDRRAFREAETARISRLLQDLAEFRAADTRVGRRAAARLAFPPPSAADEDAAREHDRVVHQALLEACDAVDEAASRVYARLEGDMDTLAEAAADAGVLAQAPTVAVRKIRLSDFLIQQSGGYAPPRRILELLLNHPRLKVPRQRKPAAATVQPALA